MMPKVLQNRTASSASANGTGVHWDPAWHRHEDWNFPSVLSVLPILTGNPVVFEYDELLATLTTALQPMIRIHPNWTKIENGSRHERKWIQLIQITSLAHIGAADGRPLMLNVPLDAQFSSGYLPWAQCCRDIIAIAKWRSGALYVFPLHVQTLNDDAILCSPRQ